MSPKKDTQKSATPALAGGARKSTNAVNKKSKGWTDVEKAAMKARVQELKAEARAGKYRAEGEKAILAAIAAMKDPTDRLMGKRIHEIVTAAAPELMPKTWYGMPAYADKDGMVICFFQAASKFGVRYATFGFQPDAKLDDGNMWGASFSVDQVDRLKSAFRLASASAGGLSSEAASALAAQTDSTRQAFVDAMDDDFNTPLALASLYELVKAVNAARDNGATDEQLAPAQKTLRELTGGLGLQLSLEKTGSSEQEAQVNVLIAERNEARRQKQWARSDQIRDQLKEMGVVIEDTKEGTKWRWG